jgi:hypothetical protein
VPLPLAQVRAHKRFEQPAVVGNAKVQKLVRDHEILKAGVLVGEVGGKGDVA